MQVLRTGIPDVLVLEPVVHGDPRGFFFESYNRRALKGIGIDREFVQDNHSRSIQGVLRGLHYQMRRPQGKLVRVLDGTVFDVAVDIRRSSPTFGKWVGQHLSSANRLMMWIPPGFAHGFLALSERAEFFYKCTEFYDPDDERTLLWNDPQIGIEWPLAPGIEPLLSAKDLAGSELSDAECYP